MFVAMDREGNRVYADDDRQFTDCLCPVCGSRLTHRKGNIRRHHFAHTANPDCSMNRNKDYNNEWHIRMQSYFPREWREYRFKDQETGEIHIADVFDIDTNTVIEFQHSSISQEEYLSRTNFHLNNGRRIVWIFDESTKKPWEGCIGRLKPDDLFAPSRNFKGVPLWWIYKGRSYKWMRTPRAFLAAGPKLRSDDTQYSVFVYTGENENTVCRVVKEDCEFKFVTLSVDETIMSENMSPDLFFIPEQQLLTQSPWKEIIEAEKKRIEEEKREKEEKEREAAEKYTEWMREDIRRYRRKREGWSTDLSICPWCGGRLKKCYKDKGKYYESIVYICEYYPECKFEENDHL